MKNEASSNNQSSPNQPPVSEEEVSTRMRRLRENGREANVSDDVLRDRARAELEQERRQTNKTVRGETSPPPSTPE